MTPEEKADQARREVERLAERFNGRSQYQRTVQLACAEVLRALEGYEQSRAAEVAAVEAAFQREVDRERERSVRTGRELAAEKARADEARRAMKKVAELKSDHSALRFEAPRGEYGRLAPWTVDDVEAALYDVRVSGGDGSTELKLTDKSIECRVPYPETVVAGRAQPQPPAMPEGDDPRAGHPVPSLYAAGRVPNLWMLVAGVALVLGALAVGAVIL